MAEQAESLATLAGRALPVLGTDGTETRIDLVGAGLGGAWITMRWRDAGSGGIARVLFSAVSDSGETVALAEEPLGGDAFAWTGRLPPDVAALRVTALSRTSPSDLRMSRSAAAGASDLSRGPASASPA
ncbi:hypothetical protein GCM10025880_49010 [Methylorubrum aminovorans]|nr:hypothetical protein GCM10025880_49010 [Methylorubrum aminovorans]